MRTPSSAIPLGRAPHPVCAVWLIIRLGNCRGAGPCLHITTPGSSNICPAGAPAVPQPPRLLLRILARQLQQRRSRGQHRGLHPLSSRGSSGSLPSCGRWGRPRLALRHPARGGRQLRGRRTAHGHARLQVHPSGVLPPHRARRPVAPHELLSRCAGRSLTCGRLAKKWRWVAMRCALLRWGIMCGTIGPRRRRLVLQSPRRTHQVPCRYRASTHALLGPPLAASIEYIH